MKNNLSNSDIAFYLSELLKYNKIKNVCICPGSRNTPLTLSFLNNPYFNCTYHIDERSSAYFSLGISKRLKKPSIIITTSGTAVGNLLPAIIEADLSMTPLIVITADRPKKTIGTGENQTIKQDAIFKDFVRESIHIKNKKIRITILQNMINKCMGINKKYPPGPIHINVSFEEPIVDSINIKKIDFSNIIKTNVTFKNKNLSCITKKPLIICGENNNSKNNKIILALAKKLNAPIFADPISQLRYHTKDKHIFSLYDFYIDRLPSKPDLIIRFGRKPVSKQINDYLKRFKGKIVLLLENKIYNDNAAPYSLSTTNLKSDVQSKFWFDKLYNLEQQTITKMNSKIKSSFFEGSIIATCIENLKDNDNLFIGNSLSIRMLEQYTINIRKKINVYSNRGASGIDGLISTSLGMSYANQKNRNILILGDVSFFYDLNALLITHNHNINLSIVILNNNGGKIFKSLPYAKDIKEKHNKFWLTPVDLNIKKISNLYKGKYSNLKSILDINKRLNSIIDTKGINIIEINC